MSKASFMEGKHLPFWIDTTPATQYPSLDEEIETDVVIIGGGITGLTAAYVLKQKGKKVAVVEADKIAEGVTGHTTAKITSLHTLIYDQLVKRFGTDKARLYGDAQETALEFISSLVKEHKIDCDFRKVPAYTFAWDENQEYKVKQEAEVALSLGLPASFVKETDLPFKTKGAVRFDNQARFHPRKYLLSIARLIPDRNNYIFENTRALDVKEGSVIEVVTQNGKITARDVIVATNYPVLNKGGFFTRLTPMRSYVLGVYSDSSIPDAMYISSDSPVYSIRKQPTPKGDMVIITGEEHKTGETSDTKYYYEHLKKMTEKLIGISSVDYFWSTQDAYSIDSTPYIGRFTPHSKNLYIASGFMGWGMTNGTVAGILLSDMITGNKNKWEAVFDPSRREQVQSAKKFVNQNISVAKEFIKGKINKSKKMNAEIIERGKGEVIRKDGKDIAVYKDEEGNVMCLSAACTHMGCTINFNNAEKSWDCPCHGSRFDVNGEVLHGPATKPLKGAK
jgi:glycine/D-amino acid oxidase-like deaminating enzyme/nitrite reductase/ring-hydroxylating ferredoxin subunit